MASVPTATSVPPSASAAPPEATPSGSAGAATQEPTPTPVAFDDALLAIELRDVRTGEAFTLGELAADAPVIVETMAIWCTNCRQQMHQVTAAHELAEFHSVSIDVEPTEIAEDLVGVRFVFFEDATGDKRWTVEPGEVRALEVVDGSTAAGGDRHRARVHLTLAAANRTISGAMDVYYRRAGARWTFEEAARAGANWSVRELAAVVYDVRRPAPADTTADARDVWLEPMFRYHDGAYTAPLAPYAGRVEAIRDSSFASDSLRRAARGGLEARVARRYLDPAWTVFLLAPGLAPEPTRIVEREASLWGCTHLGGRARSSTASGRTRAAGLRTATRRADERALVPIPRQPRLCGQLMCERSATHAPRVG